MGTLTFVGKSDSRTPELMSDDIGQDSWALTSYPTQWPDRLPAYSKWGLKITVKSGENCLFSITPTSSPSSDIDLVTYVNWGTWTKDKVLNTRSHDERVSLINPFSWDIDFAILIKNNVSGESEDIDVNIELNKGSRLTPVP